MAQAEKTTQLPAALEEVQQGWHELQLRVSQLEGERSAMEQENKTLRFMLERMIEHRKRTHSELVLLLTGLVSKLPISDVGLLVSQLVEHNKNVSEVSATMAKGNVEEQLPQPSVLKVLDQAKRDLAAAVKPAVEDLLKLDTAYDPEMLKALIEKPLLFYEPEYVRANRCFVKGQLSQQRVLHEFGEAALIFFNDLTTDPKLNPRPKPEEIVLGFKEDFTELLKQNPSVVPDKHGDLQKLFRCSQQVRESGEAARQQRRAFARLSLLLELIHYYEHQNTEAPDAVFAQRLPGLVEQYVVLGVDKALDEATVGSAEELLGYIVNPDHRLMVINNIGKGGGLARSLRFVLTFRTDKLADQEHLIAEYVRHLIPLQAKSVPPAKELSDQLRLIHSEMQPLIVRGIMSCDRLNRPDADALGRAIATELGLKGLDEAPKSQSAISPEIERQIAWDHIKELISRRAEPAQVAAAVRDRLRAKYEPEELKQSWITLMEVDSIAFIRVFCQLAYLENGQADPVARAAMQTYANRLTHEKYAAFYTKVLNSLRNMFRANPASPTLVNFVALMKWVDPEAAAQVSQDVGMPLSA